jgi:hypothetical protein
MVIEINGDLATKRLGDQEIKVLIINTQSFQNAESSIKTDNQKKLILT